MRYLAFLLFLLLLFPGQLLAADPMMADLTYPCATANGKFKTERYNKLEILVKGKGYVPYYGETHSQKFNYPKFTDDSYKDKVPAFFAERLGFDVAAFGGSYATFSQGSDTYWLKLDTYNYSYTYTLLKIAPCPEVITLPVKGDYLFQKKELEIPRHPLIPNVEGYGISRGKYFDYDEVDFYFNREKNTLKGRHWKLDFGKTGKADDSIRYIAAHDYKAKLTEMGGEILEDKDDSFVFRYNGAVAKFNSYNNTFSLEIIQEETFTQSLILTPDAIKSELDNSGKITLEGIYFDFDKATLKPESRKAILSAVALMQRYPDLVLSVNGYTDDKGSDDYNLKLSADRAAAVKGVMEAEGIETSRLSSRGHGEKEPVADNASEEGRAQNRRVELSITIDESKVPQNEG